MDATSSSLPLDAEGDRWSVLLEEGVRVVRLRHLVERLDADFDVDAGGHRQLRAINDPFELAVVSDLVARSAGGVAENLLEARVAQRDAEALMPAGGSKLTRRSSGREHVLRNARLDMAIGTLTACLSSAFDCIAACAIVVMRIAKPIKRAQLSQFADVNITPPTSLGIERLADWRTLLDFHRHGPPTGWFDWLSGMRNLRVHRARQNRIWVQRTRSADQPQVIVLTGEPEDVNRSMARFDLHLRCRPHLADMEDFVMAPDVNQLWLEETAPTTLSGVFDAANQFIEEAAQVLLAWWEYSEKWNGALPPPLKAWRPDTALGPSFSGVAPTGQPFQPAAGMVHPSLAKRLAVAERLRQQGTLPGAERSV